MATGPVAAPRPGRLSFRWILDARTDLVWYVGSSLVGWLYAGVVLLAVALLASPLEDSFGLLRLGGLEVPLTLRLLVYSSWAFLLDAPHVWSTLARTFLDPDERKVRRRELWLSWGWFLLGPAATLAPYLAGAYLGVRIPLWLGAVAFTVFFRIWAYYHVVRQHWGFMVLYKRKNEDLDPLTTKVDVWFFNLALYAPLFMFITGSIYGQTPGMPALGLESLGVTAVLHRLTQAVFVLATAGYVGIQVWLWRRATTSSTTASSGSTVGRSTCVLTGRSGSVRHASSLAACGSTWARGCSSPSPSTGGPGSTGCRRRPGWLWTGHS